MGLFGFGKEKKKQQPKEFQAEGFGAMRYLADWYTVKTFPIVVFEKKYDVTLHAVCKDKEKVIGEQQIHACMFYLRNVHEYEEKIEKQLRELLPQYEKTEITELLELQDIYFAEDGSFGISAALALDDDELAEIGIGPENEFGIALGPECFVVYSGEEFLTLYGY